jgi:hypothetical protein
LRGLVTMAEARRSFAWKQTATLAYLIAEPNRDRTSHPEPFDVNTFNPYAETPAETDQPIATVNAQQLAQIIRTGQLPPELTPNP